METLNYEVLAKSGYQGYILKDAPEKVLQFGEGNFLRAFVDYWFDVSNEKAGWNGKCCLVQPIAPGLAKLMNALYLPTEGRVLVCGLDTAQDEEVWHVRRHAGMVFQNPDNQIIGNTVEEDVGFGPENLGVPTEEIWKRVDESLEAVGMTAYRLKSPNKLSGGQKQRVSIAGVMAMKPQCIILDEPTAMLDPNGRKDVIRTVHELNRQEGITVLLITHYMEEAVDADRVIVMDEGRVVMDGTPREIFSRVKELKKYRLDVPQVTELADELAEAGLPVSRGVLTMDELLAQLVPYMKEHMTCQSKQ